ncbi:hypothetical protein WJX72_002889 [[Myrmecia] bisecta]|uniref:RNA-editing substrate-binding complex 6 protein domain-containing protein n=1 Tax=[Myrmecia] bisecta TaxID=41462 RepID=A0AAW1QEK9_9CHLO
MHLLLPASCVATSRSAAQQHRGRGRASETQGTMLVDLEAALGEDMATPAAAERCAHGSPMYAVDQDSFGNDGSLPGQDASLSFDSEDAEDVQQAAALSSTLTGQPFDYALMAEQSSNLWRAINQATSVPQLTHILQDQGDAFVEGHVVAAFIALAQLRKGQPREHREEELAAAMAALEPLARRLRTAFLPGQLCTMARSLALLGRGDSCARLLVLFEQQLAGWDIRSDFRLQGLADYLWACARLQHQPDRLLLESITSTLAAADGAMLQDATGMQLSMTLWALAKLGHQPEDGVVHGVANNLAQAGKVAKLTNKGLVMLLWACATLHHHHEPLLQLLAGEFAQRLGTRRIADDSYSNNGSSAQPDGFTIGSVATIMWAFGKLFYSPPNMATVSQAAQQHLDGMAPHELVRILLALCKLGHRPTGLLRDVTQRMAEPAYLQAFTFLDLTMLVWSFASANHSPGSAALAAIADRVQALTNMLWSYSKLAYRHEGLFAVCGPLLEANAGLLQPVHLADAARAYAKFGNAPAPLMDAIAARAVAVIDDFSTNDIMRLIAAFGSLGLQPQELLEAVDLWADRQLRHLSPQALSIAMWTFARMGNASPNLLQTAAACAQRQVSAFTPLQLSRMAWAFAKLGHSAPEFMRGVAHILKERVAEFEAKPVSNTLWALAKAGLPRQVMEEVLDVVSRDLQPRMKGFGAQSLANTLWAFASFAHPPSPQFMANLSEAAVLQLKTFEPQGVANLVWAYAKLGYQPKPLLQLIADQAPAQIRSFEPQHLANLMWGYAKLGYNPGRPFCASLTGAAQAQLHAFKSQEMFNMAWACARLKYHAPKFMDPLAKEVTTRMHEFSPQELVNTLWAYARLRHRSKLVHHMLEAACLELPRKLPLFQDRHVATLLWAFAENSFGPPETLALCTTALQGRLGGMPARDLSMILTSLARLRYDAGQLTGEMEDAARAILPDFKGFELAGLLWAFAYLGRTPARLLAAIEANERAASHLAGVGRPGQGNLGHLADLFWALTFFQAYDSAMYPAIDERISSLSHRFAFTSAPLQQLMQGIHLAHAEHGAAPKVNKVLASRARSMYLADPGYAALTPTALGVANIVIGMGIDTTTRTNLYKVLMTLPIVLTLPRGPVAMLILRPTDLSKGAGTPLGSVLVSKRLVETQGYRVVFVKQPEWEALQGTADRQRYVQELLASR